MASIGKIARGIFYIFLFLLACLIGVASFSSSIYGAISSMFTPVSSKLIYGPPSANLSSGPANTPSPVPPSTLK